MNHSPSISELDALRSDIAKFLKEIILENYYFSSGQKETFEISPIYERYGHLASKDLAKNILARWNAAKSPDEKRSYKHFFDIAFFGYIGNLEKEITEAMMKRQNEMKVQFDGEEIAYHGIFPRLMNEPDREKRKALDDLATELEIELNEFRMQAWKVSFDVFREFGFGNYKEGCEKAFGIDYDWLAGELKSFLNATEAEYIRVFDKLSKKRLGYPIGDAHKYDIGYLMRAEGFDQYFPKEGMVEKALKFASEMGMPIDKVKPITLDIAEREKKRPRAFCSPAKPGEEVYVCLRPMGGMADYSTFLHELGHAYHFAYTDPSLPTELIMLGDSATSEIYAFNFQYLAADPGWLQRYIGIDDPSEIVESERVRKLYFLRRYASKFLYEIELLSDFNIEGKSNLYSKYLDNGLKAKHRPENWLSDLDGELYSAGYLRAWIFEVQLRDYFKKEFGDEWYRNPSTGKKLKEFWKTGRMYMPEELCQHILGQKLSLDSIKRELKG
ncbi:MAG: hypothetical protein NTY09_07175 [bacterium]|nr:hypothetical protein [bacterium]